MTAANKALSTETPAAVTFDTLSAAQALRKSGFEDRQAEAIVTTISKAMSETLATKADLELQGHKTRGEIVATRTDLEKQIAATRAEIEKLAQTMASNQDKTIIRLGGLIVSMAFLFLAAGPFYIRWVLSLMAS